MMAGCGVVVALAALILVKEPRSPTGSTSSAAERGTVMRSGFGVLFLIGSLDTAARMGLLLFLPFALARKGAGMETIGLGLTLVFVGGAAGKFICGFLGDRLGATRTAQMTEMGAALLICALLLTPLSATLIGLPLLGLCLNGTSSILYGAVPEFAGSNLSRAFAVFYTGNIGSGAIAPVLFGVLADYSSQSVGLLLVALTCLVTLPLFSLLSRIMAVNRCNPC
jgi:MFS transporter, FSR family, fosmidomycin resistance protein